MKEVVTKGKFLEWGSVKIINKQMIYKELGSAAPQSFISLLRFHVNSTPEAHFHWVVFQETQMRFTLSRCRTCLSRTLTRDFLLIKPYGNKKHFINKSKKLLGHELRVSFLKQALAFH